MAYDIGPRIGIEGEAQFRQAINALNTSFKTLGTEMAAVTSAFDKNDKSSKALTAQYVDALLAIFDKSVGKTGRLDLGKHGFRIGLL